MPQKTHQTVQKTAKNHDRQAQILGLRIMVDFGATIAIPVVLFSWIGKQLDARWHTAPILLIAGFVLAFTLSAISIYRKAKQYAKLYKEI